MNREIKFRAWGGNTMWYPETKTVDGNNTTLNFFNPQLGIVWGLYDNKFDYRVCSGEHHELMQFTGLKDKNGTEIYEGDIVKMLCPYRENEVICEIRYVNGGFVVEANGWFNGGEADVTTVGWAIDQDIEIGVIGNIYEHPELTKIQTT